MIARIVPGRAQGILTVLLAAGFFAGCGVKGMDELNKRTGHEDRAADDAAAFDLTTGEAATSVVQLRIMKTYCRNGIGPMLVPTYCTGTVIDDRFVLTASHCFASEIDSAQASCSGLSNTIQMANVSIPSGPVAGGNMTAFDWSNGATKLNAKNVGVITKSGSTTQTPAGHALGWSQYFSGGYGNGIIRVNGKDYHAAYTATDQALVDFGATALAKYTKLGYAQYPQMNSTQFGKVPFTPVGFGTPDGTAFSLSVRPNLMAWSNEYNGGYRTDQYAEGDMILVPGDVAQVASCHGDSGGPLISTTGTSAGKVVAVASIKYNGVNDPAKNDNLTCKPTGTSTYSIETATYSLVIPSQIDAMKSKLASAAAVSGLTFAENLYTVTYDVSKTGAANAARFVSTLVAPHAIAPATPAATSIDQTATTAAWARVKNPAAPTTVLTSYYAGGIMNVITAGSGRTATWTATGLAAGCYQVDLYYQESAKNTGCAQFNVQVNTGAAWAQAPLAQNAGGIASSTVATTNGWKPVYKTIVNPATKGVYVPAANGKIKVTISAPSTCTAGFIVADTIKLTAFAARNPNATAYTCIK